MFSKLKQMIIKKEFLKLERIFFFSYNNTPLRDIFNQCLKDLKNKYFEKDFFFQFLELGEGRGGWMEVTLEVNKQSCCVRNFLFYRFGANPIKYNCCSKMTLLVLISLADVVS